MFALLRRIIPIDWLVWVKNIFSPRSYERAREKFLTDLLAFGIPEPVVLFLDDEMFELKQKHLGISGAKLGLFQPPNVVIVRKGREKDEEILFHEYVHYVHHILDSLFNDRKPEVIVRQRRWREIVAYGLTRLYLDLAWELPDYGKEL